MPSLHSFKELLGGEKEIERALQEHSSLALKAAQGIPDVVTRLVAGDYDGARSSYHEVDRLETAADESHRRIVEAVSSGVFFSGIGEDIMNLSEEIDDVADNAKDSSRVLILRRLGSEEIAGVSDQIQNYLTTIIRAVTALSRAVNALGGRREEVMLYITDAERSEEAADEIKDQLIARIYSLPIPVLSVIQLKDFVLLADNVADHAEDASDQLLILLSKGYA